MLIKWIVCEVAPESCAAFSAAQEQWRSLRTVDGFLGQFGGWNDRQPSDSCQLACILGLWRDSDSYRSFMHELHDPLVTASRQAATYIRATTALFDVQLDIAGSQPGLCRAQQHSQYLRVADCDVRPDRREHFCQVQADVWNPGMACSSGLIGGAFGPSQPAPMRFLVTTLWESAEAHAKYVRDVLPRLRTRAAVEDDVTNLQGYGVALKPDWRVCSAP